MNRGSHSRPSRLGLGWPHRRPGPRATSRGQHGSACWRCSHPSTSSLFLTPSRGRYREPAGSTRGSLRSLSRSWIEVAPVNSEAEIEGYSRYAPRLVGDDGRNTGECGVLALPEVHGLVAVVDDYAGHKAASANGIQARRTLGLLCDAVADGLLTLDTVSAVADSLLQTDYRLPFPPGGFAQ